MFLNREDPEQDSPRVEAPHRLSDLTSFLFSLTPPLSRRPRRDMRMKTHENRIRVVGKEEGTWVQMERRRDIDIEKNGNDKNYDGSLNRKRDEEETPRYKSLETTIKEKYEKV